MKNINPAFFPPKDRPNLVQAIFSHEAKKNVPVAELSVHQAEEGFRIAEERYKEHITTSTEVLDAQTLLTQAKTNYYTALYNCNIALAKLYRAIGMCNNME